MFRTKDRLKQLRQNLGLNQEEFANHLKIGRSTIANYEAGTREPTSSVISLICKNWNVNEEWLRTGSGEMYQKVDEFETFYRLADRMLRDESADVKRRLITALMKLDSAQIEKAVNWMLETFAPGTGQEPREPTIEEKVEAYRAELEMEDAAKKSEALQTTNEKREA